MNRTLLAPFLLLMFSTQAANVHVQLSAPSYAGQHALLYRCMDLITLRTELLANTVIDQRGQALVEADVQGTQKGMIRIGEVTCELWLRAGSYTVELPAPDSKAPRSLNGTTQVDPIFKNMDRLDINALIGDLNERLDGFIAEDLATDRKAGMQAVDIEHKNPGTLKPDSAKRPGTLFITPNYSRARVDSFEMKLRKFYADVKDPWFWQDLDYGIAGLRFGPRANDKELFEHYLKGKPVLYDVPEYIRFIGSFFEDHLMRYPYRAHEDAMIDAIHAALADSVKMMFMEHDFLHDDALAELVMLQELYANYNGKTFDRAGIRSIFDHLSTGSVHPEHMRIAADMLWDLTAMRIGGTLPSLVLRSTDGTQVHVDSLLHGATCLAVTASWCTYCEQEMVALETLNKEYGAYIRIVAISLDKSANDLAAYTKAHPQRDWLWLYGGDDPTIMDMLRIRSIPAFFLLNDGTLAQVPAPPPSNGLASILFRMKAQADEQNKLRPDNGQHPPRH